MSTKPINIADAVKGAVTSATKDWAKQRKADERERQNRQSRDAEELADASPPSPYHLEDMQADRRRGSQRA